MTGLRVTGVERIVLDVPPRERCRPWNELLVGQWGVIELVRVTTDSPGIVGYGEAMVHYGLTAGDEAVARTVGRNPAELLWDDSLGWGLQAALFDVVGQQLEVPMHALLGRPQVRSRCPLSWWNTKMPAEILAEEARDAVAEGYRAHKIKGRPWFDVREQVAAISAATPDGYMIDIDFNELLLDVNTARELLVELDAEPKIGLYETPLKMGDVAAAHRLRQLVAHPIVEHLEQIPFPIGIAADAYDGYVIGGTDRGVTGLLNNGLLASGFGKPFFLQLVGTGLTTALALHVGSVLPGAYLPYVTCVNTYADDLLVEPIAVVNGLAAVPDAPGLGVTVDEHAIEMLRMRPPYAHEFEPKVLTVTWPADDNGRARGPQHYASIPQLFEDSRAANVPPLARGARLSVRTDDGSAEWLRLHELTMRHPVYE